MKYAVEEQDPGLYSVSYKLNGGQAHSGKSTGEQTLSQDTAVAYTNSLNTVVPTGVSVDFNRVIGFALISFGCFGLYLLLHHLKKRTYL